jgi:hypothetical protein
LTNEFRKYRRGFAAYEVNTGHAHALSEKIGSKKRKRDAGDVPLADENAELWYASIGVGSPAKTFTGEHVLSSSSEEMLKLY